MMYLAGVMKNQKYLTKTEEIELFNNYKNNNCLKSVETLIVSNLRYIAKMAREYKNSKVSKLDLFQEGTIGLMKAVKNFDLSYNVRLITYAIPYIKNAMMEYVINHIGIVKTITTKPHRKLFFNLNKLRGENECLSQGDIKRIASELNVTEYDVVDIDSRLTNREFSIDSFSTNDGNAFHEITEDENDTSYITLREQDEKFEAIQEAIYTLTERERYIFLSRNLIDDVIGLKELSEELGISMERVRQLNQKSFEKVQKYVLNKFKN